MFRPETEDMLPRAAPKPSTPNMSLGPEVMVMPQVPEVSILCLYGQQTQSETASTAGTTGAPAQSYAAWRKQVLPRVTFPPEGSEVTGILTNTSGHSAASTTAAAPELVTARSNLYPLRTITATMPPTAAIAAGIPDSYGANSMHYRRCLSSLPLDVNAGVNSPTLQQLQQQRRSLDTITQFTCASTTARSTPPTQEVLTICAGTQTDAERANPLNSQMLQEFATKDDFTQLLTAMQTIREDQLRLMEICEALVLKQQHEKQVPELAINTYFRDVSTQCDIPAQLNVNQRHAPPSVQEEAVGSENAATDYYAQTFNSPVPTPAATSTAYRPNTPRTNVLIVQEKQQMQQQNNNNVATVLPNPSTEKSMVMNELALKYLPSEKLTQLLKELHVCPSTQQAIQTAAASATPLRAIENMENSPSDLSNASYKYLKKYRLLPEEQVGGYHEQQLNVAQRKSPITGRQQMQQQQQQQRQSSYQHVQSPLAMGRAQQEEMLDLEHIRNQPKLL